MELKNTAILHVSSNQNKVLRFQALDWWFSGHSLEIAILKLSYQPAEIKDLKVL